MDSLQYLQDTLLRIAPKPADWPEYRHYDTPNELFHHLLTKGWFTKSIRKELFGWDDATDDLFVKDHYLGTQLNEDAIMKQIPAMNPTYDYDEDFFEERMPDQKPYQRKMQYYLRLMVVERRLQDMDYDIAKLVYDDEKESQLYKLIYYYIIDDSEFDDVLQEYCNDKGI